MPDNPYTRSVSIEVVELVPSKDQLPRCRAWKEDAQQCALPGKYLQDGLPVCGVHVGRPSLLFIPERWVRG